MAFEVFLMYLNENGNPYGEASCDPRGII